MENNVAVLSADLAHCAASAARYEALTFGEKVLDQAAARYAKDLAKYYRDAAEKIRDLYLKFMQVELGKVVATQELRAAVVQGAALTKDMDDALRAHKDGVVAVPETVPLFAEDEEDTYGDDLAKEER